MTEERDKNEFKDTEPRWPQPTSQKKPGETETDKQADRTSGQGTDNPPIRASSGRRPAKGRCETGQPARSSGQETDVDKVQQAPPDVVT